MKTATLPAPAPSIAAPDTAPAALVRLEMVGATQSRLTGWRYRPGHSVAHLSNGRTKFFPEGNSTAQMLADLTLAGVSVAAFQRACVAGMLAHSYPPRPTYATHFQHNYGNELPVTVERWQWSETFGRWSALVTFADGWRGFTYPQISDANARTPAGLAALWIAENTAGLVAAGVPVEMAFDESAAYFARSDVRSY